MYLYTLTAVFQNTEVKISTCLLVLVDPAHDPYLNRIQVRQRGI